MLKAAQVCEQLGISSDTLVRLIKAGEFPGAMRATRRPRSHWRIPEEALADYIKRSAMTAAQETAVKP
jgi:excisionase family DNA binding protein